jgi:prophage regulatory protein
MEPGVYDPGVGWAALHPELGCRGGFKKMAEKILRLPAVRALTGLSRSTVYEKISAGEFPKGISLGARSVGWLESEVQAWIFKKVSASRQFSREGLV